MRRSTAVALATSLLVVFHLNALALTASPIKANVPIFVPADVPVSGWVCLPNEMAAGLKAKLYVDGDYLTEGEANETGCYRVTLPPLSPGKHDLFTEIYKGPLEVATISAEVTAIPNMIYVGPNPLTEIPLGSRVNATLILMNKSPIDLEDVIVEIESPVPAFGVGMTRRDNVLKGSFGNVPVNSTLKIPLTLAVPRTFSLRTGELNIKIIYKIGDFTYEIKKVVTFTVTKGGTAQIEAKLTTSQPTTSTSQTVRPDLGSKPSLELPLIILLIALIAMMLGFIALMRRKGKIEG